MTLDKKGHITNYNRPSNITRMHVFLATGYIFKTKIKGSYFPCETEEDVYESIQHFKFLLKFNLI